MTILAKPTRCVVFSLYGDSQMYMKGMIENARLVREVYPGWGIRVYCDTKVVAAELRKWGCDVRVMIRTRKHSGMFWRFLAAWDSTLDIALFRDADSRLNVKEAAAVQEWIESGRVLHSMHDHPHHCHHPILGGMWGIRPGNLPEELRVLVLKLSQRPQKRVADMTFLRQRVYPLLKDSVLHHSSHLIKEDFSPFPYHFPIEGFVGQQFDEKGQPIWPAL